MGIFIVRLDRVDVRLHGRDLLRGVSLAVRPGESWAVVGGNGAGKSTLLRLLQGAEQPTPATRHRRRYGAGGGSPSPIGTRERVALVSPEQQEAYLRWDWDLPAEAVVRSGFSGELWPPAPASPAQARAVRAAARRLGVEPLLPRSVLTLSTGELRRVLLARALVGKPALLLLDEPCDGLDAGAREELLRRLAALARRGPTMVVATHRPEEIVPGIARVARLEGGRLVEQGGREEMLARMGATGTASRTASRTATPTPTPSPTPSPSPSPSPAPDSASTSTSTATSARRGRPLLRLSRATVLLGGRPVLRDLTWTVRPGEHWAVVGGNGAGKSTLLRLAVGDEQARPGGTVARLGLAPGADVWEVKARAGVVSPELQARFRADLGAEAAVLSGLTSSIGIDFVPSPAQLRQARDAMRQAGALHLAGRRIHALSYGEFRRLLLARALVRRPRLLVLDEPMNGLDPAAREALGRTLLRLARAGTTLLMATHHRGELPAVVTHELELRGGAAIYLGPRR